MSEKTKFANLQAEIKSLQNQVTEADHASIEDTLQYNKMLDILDKTTKQRDEMASIIQWHIGHLSQFGGSKETARILKENLDKILGE